MYIIYKKNEFTKLFDLKFTKFIMDSELVIKQIKGEFRINRPNKLVLNKIVNYILINLGKYFCLKK